jgi:hypothetical protein
MRATAGKLSCMGNTVLISERTLAPEHACAVMQYPLASTSLNEALTEIYREHFADRFVRAGINPKSVSVRENIHGRTFLVFTRPEDATIFRMFNPEFQ